MNTNITQLLDLIAQIAPNKYLHYSGFRRAGRNSHIGIRSTRMLTRDDVEITVPNSIMGNAKILNETGGPSEKYRIRIKV